ncbi:hypothetical protein [Streptomyces sp. ISL-94]|uniref:hypothetical protein n=1 Tax=Streptomyces sp. ISL-94 TaxID=2819190 RepID=UPI001BECF6DD|nr:hypothetical protein [Streptomyces sp. ISL-94]MBT2477093.1 hypothetical protein [Streptomyces sp. ISL-94]
MELGRQPRIRVWAAAAVLAGVSLPSGCSSDAGSGAGGSAAAVGVPVVGVPVVQTGTGPADPAAAEAQIEKNWAALFDPKVTAEEKAGLVENGELLQPLLEGLAGRPGADKASAEVTEVVFTSPTEARVTYDLLVSGFPVLDGRTADVVLEDGVWKISTKSLCGLAELSGSSTSVPGC